MIYNFEKKNNKREDSFKLINIVPLIDVMLILMVVFMMLISFSNYQNQFNSDLDIKVPKKSQNENKQKTQVSNNKISIYMKDIQNIYVNEQKVNIYNFIAILDQVADKIQYNDEEINLFFDKDVKYQEIIMIISKMNQAGFYKTVFVVEEDDR